MGGMAEMFTSAKQVGEAGSTVQKAADAAQTLKTVTGFTKDMELMSQLAGTASNLNSASHDIAAADRQSRSHALKGAGKTSVNMSPTEIRAGAPAQAVQSFAPAQGQDLASILAQLSQGRGI